MFTIMVFIAAASLAGGMIGLMYVGRWLAARRAARDPVRMEGGAAGIDGAVLGLLGLLVAFTFSGAAGRFDVRRQQVIDETNAIGTAYLRIAMLPPAARAALQQQVRTYVDSRIATYRQLPDIDAALAEWSRSKQLQQEIWASAVDATTMAGAHLGAPMVVLPALNQMFDIAATRIAMTQLHPPAVVFVLLFVISLLSALLSGDALSRRTSISRVHVIGFAMIVAAAVFVIIDLEFPRLGLFQERDFDRLLVAVRADMK